MAELTSGASDLAAAEQAVRARPALALRALSFALLALSLLALFAQSFRHMDLLGDSFWSVATGRWILEHGALPERDPFSYTASGNWIVHMPLCQIVLAWVERVAGVLGLAAVGALLFAAALALLWLAHARSELARIATWPLVLLLVALQIDDLCVRGQLFGDLGLALLLVCLFRLRDGQRVHPLAPLVLGSLWINLHASAFLSVALPLVFAALLWLDARLVRPRSLALVPWLVFAGLAALGLLVNPYGFALVRDLIALMLAPSTASIDLFLPPDFSSLPTLLALAVELAAVALLIQRRDATAGLPEAALLVLSMLAACSARRYEPIALAIAIAVLARALSRAAPSWLEHASLRLSAQLIAAVLAVVVTLHGLSADKDPWRDVPLDEALLIEQRGLPDRVANAYHWGGFLDYAWAGRRQVMIDGRNQLFEGQVFDDVTRLEHAEGWAEVLARYGVHTVLWERGSALDRALAQSPDWLLVSRGRIAVVYVRQRPLEPHAAR